MALREYTISYKDGSTQTLNTPGPKVDGGWVAFTDGGGVQLVVRAEDVESITRSDIPERTGKTAAPKAA
jgi:hypothetical protein